MTKKALEAQRAAFHVLVSKDKSTNLFQREYRWKEELTAEMAEFLEEYSSTHTSASGKEYRRTEIDGIWVFLPIDPVEEGDLLVCVKGNGDRKYDTLSVEKGA